MSPRMKKFLEEGRMEGEKEVVSAIHRRIANKESINIKI